MKLNTALSLRARLVLYGAVLPSLLLGASVGIGGHLFENALLDGIDRALTTQAAVEAVSLFDSPTNEPHIHVERSPLVDRLGEGVARIAVYDEAGKLVLHFPRVASVPPRLALKSISDSYELSTRVRFGGERLREVVLRVRSDEGRPYALWLGYPMASYDATLGTYYRTSGLTVAVLVLLLFGVQRFHARSLANRLQRLAEHMQRVEQGDLSSMPESDDQGDVISSLAESIASATRRLGDMRSAQDRLMAGAAHEIRTPLATMRADIDVTLRRPRSEGELRETLERTREEVDRLGRLATELLDLTARRQTQLNRALVDLVELAGQSLRAQRSDAEDRGIRLELLGPESVEVAVDPDAIRQALDNLVSNAIKFSPRGGLVSLEVVREEGQIRILVRDRGDGVAVEQRKRIFEPFRRGDPSRSGKGLGLAIVTDIANKHGGRVFVESAEPKGAVFVLELPGPSLGQHEV